MMRVHGGAGDDRLGDVNALNLLGFEAASGTHNVGAWCLRGDDAVYVVRLPAGLAGLAGDMGAVMREVLLTLARQALLARRVLLDEDDLTDPDRDSRVGLAAPDAPRGLAWGETGEGRNIGAEVLAEIYGACVGGDAAWADPWPGGFTWWPYQQAQVVTAVPYGGANGDGAVVHIATQVRRDVTATPESLEAIAGLNAELSQSALVLREDGGLDLACRIFLHEGIRWWASRWAQTVAADQFVTARDLGEGLAGLGTPAASAHPASGPRPEPDELFGIREDYLIPAAAKVQAGLHSLVPLVAVTGQYTLPHELSADDQGGLAFTWHVSGGHHAPGTEPAVRVTVSRGESPAGIGWLVRSSVPVAGDAGTRTRWCSHRNAALFDSSGSDDQTAAGGWGTMGDGTCCLTTWLSPHFARDEVNEAAELSLLYSALLSFTQSDTRPGEQDGFPSGWHARMLPVQMEDEGLERGDDGTFTFKAGDSRARFEVEYVKFGPNRIESALWMHDPHCMRISGTVPDPDVKALAVDDDVIGSWTRYRDAVAYEVVLPPIPSAWPGSFMLEETLSWLGRHVIGHVQAAIGQ